MISARHAFVPLGLVLATGCPSVNATPGRAGRTDRTWQNRPVPDAGTQRATGDRGSPWQATHTAGVQWARATVRDEANAPLDWLVVRIDPSRVNMAIEHAPADERLESFGTVEDIRLAVNAGFFSETHTPSGLLVSRGTVLAPYRAGAGSGTLIVRNGTARIAEGPQPATGWNSNDVAIQCGPRLIEADGSVGIRRDDGQRFARTGVCVRDGGRTLDLVLTWSRAFPLRGPGLLHFARTLAAPSPFGDARGCDQALNLDGGPSTGIFVRLTAGASHASIGPVPFALVVYR